MTNKFYIKSKAKTFKKGTEWQQVFKWFDSNISVAPSDEPNQRLHTDRKYVITIKQVR